MRGRISMTYDVDLKSALIDPSAVFKRPQDVLKCSLSSADKIRILKAWEYDLRLMQTADEENMTGDEGNFLQEIHTLLRDINSPTI